MSKRFLPIQLAGIQHGQLTPLQTGAVVRIAHVAHAPPDWAGAHFAFSNVIAAIEALQLRNKGCAPEAANLIAELRLATPQLSPCNRAEATAVMMGRKSRFPVWHCLCCIAHDCTSAMLGILGAEIELALRERRPMRVGIVKRVVDFTEEASDPAQSEAVEERARSYLAKLIEELNLGLAGPRTDPRELRLNSRILASWKHQRQNPNLADRLAVDSNRLGTLEQITAAARQLRLQAEARDPTCLPTIIGHCCGIGLGLIEDVHFASHCSGEWVARIDAQIGVVQLDLSRIIEVARPKPGHVLSSGIVTIYLPVFAANLLFEVVARNPQAACMRDCCGQGYTARDELPAGDGPSGLSAAQFLRSRGMVALKAAADRGVTAVAAVDLSLIGPSTLNYNTVTAEETWRTDKRRYEALGWGLPVPMEQKPQLAVGSAVTPTCDTLQHVDAIFVDQVESLRPGRRYTVEKVVAFHNAYARLCAHRTALLVAGRGAEAFGFYADWMRSDADTVFLVDKRVGPHKGRIALAQPMRLAEQVEYWKSHLAALVRRLSKVEHPLAGRVETYAVQISAEKHVPLFFTIGDHRLETIGSAQLQAEHPEVKLNPDARRHFMINALRDEGVSFTLASAHLRHHIPGLAVTEYASNDVSVHRLDAVAQALDRVALRLGMHPVPGLLKKGV